MPACTRSGFPPSGRRSWRQVEMFREGLQMIGAAVSALRHHMNGDFEAVR